jgi:hypothetical protein
MKRPIFHVLDWIIVSVLVGGVMVEFYRYYTHQGVDVWPSILLILTAIMCFQNRKDRTPKKEPIQPLCANARRRDVIRMGLLRSVSPVVLKGSFSARPRVSHH